VAIVEEGSMPVDVGQTAPTFSLPAANRDATVSLDDYRGKTPVLLALFRGLYCPFCRHQIARLSVTAAKVRDMGVETLGVVATPASRARLYFRFHESRIPLAADPDLTTHKAYGIPGLPMTAELAQMVNDRALAFAREHNLAAAPASAHNDINAIDGYQPTAADEADFERHQAQLIGQFLIGVDGVIRWVNIEQAPGDFPSDAELLASVRASS
jgi:peroxiredoxin